MTAIWVVIPAAGAGKRFGSAVPKQYQHLLGKTVLEQTLARFAQRTDVHGIVLAVAEQDEWLASLNLPDKVSCVIGGAERADSVRAALAYLQTVAQPQDLVAVHDAARPCIRQSLLNTLFAKARQTRDGVLPVLMARETVKQVEQGRIVSTLDRSRIALAQTPQVFPLALLANALATAGTVTDDASAVEQAGFSPSVIEGDPANIKITVAQDLALAESSLALLLQEND